MWGWGSHRPRASKQLGKNQPRTHYEAQHKPTHSTTHTRCNHTHHTHPYRVTIRLQLPVLYSLSISHPALGRYNKRKPVLLTSVKWRLLHRTNSNNFGPREQTMGNPPLFKYHPAMFSKPIVVS